MFPPRRNITRADGRPFDVGAFRVAEGMEASAWLRDKPCAARATVASNFISSQGAGRCAWCGHPAKMHPSMQLQSVPS
jgi:hypothetical protein